MRSVVTRWHSLTRRSRIPEMAASLGLEPRQRDPESLVLPLHYEAKMAKDLKPLFGSLQVAQSECQKLSASCLRGQPDFRAFPSCFHFQRAAAFHHQEPRALQHLVDLVIVVLGIVMEQE